MFGLFDILKVGVGAIVGAALFTVINVTVWLPAAREETRQQERAAALQRAMDLIETRSKTNAEIRSLDDAGLCLALGGRMLENVCQ